MPTGYTADLCEREVPFEEFVLKCVRAMGVAIEMRDDPMSKPIPQRFEPSPYHEQQLAKDKSELVEVEALPADWCEGKAKSEHAEAVRDREASIVRQAATRDWLLRMRAKVVAWVPPTVDHEGFKKFMLEQLDSTIKHDGEVYRSPVPQKKSGALWKAERVQQIKENIAYHEKHRDEEIARCEERNQWLADLRASLKGDR